MSSRRSFRITGETSSSVPLPTIPGSMVVLGPLFKMTAFGRTWPRGGRDEYLRDGMAVRNGMIWADGMWDADREQWNRLADRYETPLLDWDWLRILEDSGSVGPQEGWLPHHLLVYEEGRLIAAAPMYVKTHSAGEFVFDYAWAEVAEQLGCDYYPKLVAMSPLTPAIGYRFLVDPQVNEQQVVDGMIAEITAHCREHGLHGFSVLWPEQDFAEILGDETFTPWRHQHYRWENESFATFDDYLSVFNKNQRRNIKRERSSMPDQGLIVQTRFASRVPDDHFSAMYRYYLNTNAQFGPWAARFLNGEFFRMVKESCGERVVFTMAYEAGETVPIGMAMLLYKPNRLIGRYWGADRFVNNLHFNLCYYEPIRWAIEQGVQIFDPGMGSSHKVRRGFRAVATHSLHHFTDERMQLVMRMNIDRINRYEQMHIEHLNDHLPFARHRPAQGSPR